MDPEHIITDALREFEEGLMRYSRSITGDVEAARDAVQETFLKLSRQDVVALKPRMKSWLFCVCRNCSLDYRRKIIRMPLLSDKEGVERAGEGPDPSGELIGREEARNIASLVEKLPGRQRDIIELKFAGGLSYREIAEVTGLSISNVGFQLHEATTKLRHMWKHHENETPSQKKYG